LKVNLSCLKKNCKNRKKKSKNRKKSKKLEKKKLEKIKSLFVLIDLGVGNHLVQIRRGRSWRVNGYPSVSFGISCFEIPNLNVGGIFELG